MNPGSSGEEKACKKASVICPDVVALAVDTPPRTKDDILAAEEPLEIRVNGTSVSVTMRTPGHDAELAAGFLYTEAILRKPRDLVKIQARESASPLEGGNIVDVLTAPGVAADLSKLTRHVFASSSCGLCGKASIANIQTQFPALPADNLQISAELLARLPQTLREHQTLFDGTGGVHASGIFTADGSLVVSREDVGRHNAVDKVIGYGLLEDLLPYNRHILMVSGRASFEILQKALAAGIPIVAAVSAPSSLAVDFARANRQTLVGFLRGTSMNLYTHPSRVRST